MKQPDTSPLGVMAQQAIKRAKRGAELGHAVVWVEPEVLLYLDNSAAVCCKPKGKS